MGKRSQHQKRKITYAFVWHVRRIQTEVFGRIAHIDFCHYKRGKTRQRSQSIRGNHSFEMWSSCCHNVSRCVCVCVCDSWNMWMLGRAKKKNSSEEKIETIYLSFFNRTVTRTASIALKFEPERGNIPSGVQYVTTNYIYTYSLHLYGRNTAASANTSINRTEMYHMPFHHFIYYKAEYQSFGGVGTRYVYDPHAKWIDSGSSFIFMELMRTHFGNPSVSISSHLKFQIIILYAKWYIHADNI